MTPLTIVPRDAWIDERLAELSACRTVTPTHVNQAVAEKRAGDARIAAWRKGRKSNAN